MAVSKAAPADVPTSVQGKCIAARSLPPAWVKVSLGDKKVYYNIDLHEFQADTPGTTASDIEQLDYEGLKSFLKGFDFKPKTIGKDIFSVFKKEGVTGKGLMSRSYSELVSLRVPREDARRLKLILAPLLTKADVVKLDVEDTCIWGEAISLGKETVGLLREHDVTGRKLIESKDLGEALRTLDIFGGDATKIADAVKLLNYENLKKLGLSISGEAFTVPKLGMSPLSSLLTAFPSDYCKTLEEALKEASFVCVKDMLEDAKKKWESSEEVRKSGLTEEEAAAIFVYTYDFGKDNWEKNPFRVVNKVLAERNTHVLQRLCGYILHLLSALRKLPRWRGSSVLYRVVEGPVGASTREVGSVLSWPAFTSTTVNKSAVGTFIVSARDPVVFEIRGDFCGYDISPFSALGGESEVLLEPETMFSVNKVGTDSDLPGATRIVVNAVESPLMIEDMVNDFNREKEKAKSAQK